MFGFSNCTAMGRVVVIIVTLVTPHFRLLLSYCSPTLPLDTFYFLLVEKVHYFSLLSPDFSYLKYAMDSGMPLRHLCLIQNFNDFVLMELFGISLGSLWGSKVSIS
jgi:hypothetical protein